MNEFGEPWVRTAADTLESSRGSLIEIIGGPRHFIPPLEVLDRIAACVNACKGISTDKLMQLRDGALRGFVDRLPGLSPQ